MAFQYIDMCDTEFSKEIIEAGPSRWKKQLMTVAKKVIWTKIAKEEFRVPMGIHLFCAVSLHFIIFILLFVLPKPAPSVGNKTAENVQVRIVAGPQKRAEPRANPLPVPHLKSLPSSPPKAKKVLTANTSKSEPVLVPSVPENTSPQKNSVEPSEPPPNVTTYGPRSVPKGLNRLLPGNNNAYLQDQREMGKTLGEGPVAGDIPDQAPPETADPEKRAKIVEHEYTFLGYFEMLNSRFSEAWGGTRTLPPEATFNGVVGEFIEYDIVVNKDGSLRKILNVTSKKFPHRDFSAVDKLVFEVFKVVFPLPVPARFKKDPLVIRKRIQFTGYTIKQIF